MEVAAGTGQERAKKVAGTGAEKSAGIDGETRRKLVENTQGTRELGFYVCSRDYGVRRRNEDLGEVGL